MIVEREYEEGRITFVSADVDYYSENKKQPTADMPVFMNPRRWTDLHTDGASGPSGKVLLTGVFVDLVW